jgi:hypothetical protein
MSEIKGIVYADLPEDFKLYPVELEPIKPKGFIIDIVF